MDGLGRSLNRRPVGEIRGPEAPVVEDRSYVSLDQINDRLVLEDAEVKLVQVIEQIAFERDGPRIRDLVLAACVPISDQARFQLDWVAEQLLERKANTFRGREVVVLRDSECLDVGVVDYLAQLHPYVVGSELEGVSLALVVVPWPVELLIGAESDDVTSHVARA